MRIGILGSGSVGRALATAFVNAGHEVLLGSRTGENEVSIAWAAETGGRIGTFAVAAEFGELVLNAVSGSATIDTLTSIADEIAAKIVIDVANPLDFSNGFPPTLTVTNTDSLGEQVQRAVPRARVVKVLNTVNTSVMVDPGRLTEATDLFICGEDADAKQAVVSLLAELGWDATRVRDVGGIEAARGTEAYLALWVRLMSTLGTPTFNVRLVIE